MASLPQSDQVAALLKSAKTIAVVGLSNDPMRASHGVSAYMQSHGYRVIPVNPQIESSFISTKRPVTLVSACAAVRA